MKKNNILIIGAGNMGRAIAKGLLKNPNNLIYFKTTPNTDNKIFNKEFVSHHSQIFFSHKNDYFYEIDAPWIFLAVKPHHILNVITENHDIFLKTNPKALISVAAGVLLKTIENACLEYPNIPIIRTMPNIAVAYNNGIIGYMSNNTKINDDFVNLCSLLGFVYPLVDEQQFDLFTAIAGSSPAFFAHFIEAMVQSATMIGMDYQDAEKIIIQAFLGVSSLLKLYTPKELRESVTSPNGTTAAGLSVLMNKNFSVSDSHLTELCYKTLIETKKRSENMI